MISNLKIGDKVRVIYHGEVSKVMSRTTYYEKEGVIVGFGEKKVKVDLGGFRHRLYWASSLEKINE